MHIGKADQNCHIRRRALNNTITEFQIHDFYCSGYLAEQTKIFTRTRNSIICVQTGDRMRITVKGTFECLGLVIVDV